MTQEMQALMEKEAANNRARQLGYINQMVSTNTPPDIIRRTHGPYEAQNATRELNNNNIREAVLPRN